MVASVVPLVSSSTVGWVDKSLAISTTKGSAGGTVEPDVNNVDIFVVSVGIDVKVGTGVGVGIVGTRAVVVRGTGGISGTLVIGFITVF